jgi:hypothetical protein
VLRRPDVVVAEICDVRSTGRFNTGIVRSRLRTGMLGKTDPADGPWERLPDHLLGIVCATVADDDNFDGRMGLTQGRLERRDNKAGAIAGRDDDREPWIFLPTQKRR